MQVWSYMHAVGHEYNHHCRWFRVIRQSSGFQESPLWKNGNMALMGKGGRWTDQITCADYNMSYVLYMTG